jgi:hypothetical protein
MDVVRDYLLYLRDPEALRDDSRIKELEQAVAKTDDVLEQLRLQAELVKAQSADGSQYEDGFVTHAAAYAEQHKIPVDAFRAMGVSDDVLRRAGLLQQRQTKRSTRSRVTIEEVRKSVPRGKFTIPDLVAASGASQATVRKVVAEQLEAGGLEDLGDDPKHSGVGRAPKVYKRK